MANCKDREGSGRGRMNKQAQFKVALKRNLNTQPFYCVEEFFFLVFPYAFFRRWIFSFYLWIL
jgi:hypothetical protein